MARRARFRKPRYLARSRRSGLAWVAVVLLLAAAWALFGERLMPPPPLDEVNMTFRLCGERGRGPCVIDGDTVAIGQRRVRLTGYDAPEMDGACQMEVARANDARAALHTWLAKGRFSWTGGNEPPYDRFGRELREARRGDELLADHMIEAGLAEGSGWGSRRVDWCE